MRNDEKIYYWPLCQTAVDSLDGTSDSISSNNNPRIFSKIIESAIVYQFRELENYSVYRNRHSHTWKIISEKNILHPAIEGLKVNRQVDFNTYFFKPHQKLLFGFVLSPRLKNTFTWSRQDFEKNGIDVTDLKGKDNIVFANRQSLKRFLIANGAEEIYQQQIENLDSNEQKFLVLSGLYSWLVKHKEGIYFPDGNSISSISKRYLPFENNKVRQEKIFNPRRYYFGGRTTKKGERLFYNQQVRKFKPYSFEVFHNKPIQIGVLCPKEHEGVTEGFVNKLENLLKNDFHLKKIGFKFCFTNNSSTKAYMDKLYDDELLKSNLVVVVVNEEHESLPENQSPYFICKAKYIGNGIPTQDVQIANVRNPNMFILNNLSLNIYAKLGGTAWTIEKEEKRKEELVIGIGSTTNEDGKLVMGIAQVFHSDGRYLVGDCVPLSTFANYSENLQRYLEETLNRVIDDHIDKDQEFRLIFHLFKSASSKYEIRAINNAVKKFNHLTFKYALVHLGYGHNFRLFANDGKGTIPRGTFIKLDGFTSLLHFVEDSSLPLHIKLDKRSSFTDLFYISKQVSWFSHLSHRSYKPAKRTVTITYPREMARLTERLKLVDGWDYDRLKKVADKLWFI
ncbi:MAG: hypothetical protein KDD92_02830 [Caldilineaceae bacterium]|nr:hypothetical protein [Caldilineaceae bacterium]